MIHLPWHFVPTYSSWPIRFDSVIEMPRNLPGIIGTGMARELERIAKLLGDVHTGRYVLLAHCWSSKVVVPISRAELLVGYSVKLRCTIRASCEVALATKFSGGYHRKRDPRLKFMLPCGTFKEVVPISWADLIVGYSIEFCCTTRVPFSCDRGVR